jgi:DNA-binding IclR family transcriptional regulator
MTTEKGRTTESGAKVLKVLVALSGNVINGLANGDLAKGLKESPSTINRCLNTLIDEGLAIKHDDGRFALSVKAAQLWLRCFDEIEREGNRHAEIKQRIFAGSRR